MQFINKERINQIRDYALKRRKVLIIGGIFLVISAFILFSDHGVISLISLQSKKSELAGEIDDLKTREDSLNAIINRLHSDTLEIERIAREKYGMVRKGEKVYYILKSENRDN